MDLAGWLLLLVLLFPLRWLVRRLIAAKFLAGLQFGQDRIEQIRQEALPAGIRHAVTPVLNELEALGFGVRQSWRVVSSNGAGFDCYAVEAAHGSAPIRAVVKPLCYIGNYEESGASFSTLLLDGREIVTRNYEEVAVRPQPTSIEVEFLAGADTAKLLERHRTRVRAVDTRGLLLLALDADAARAREQALMDEGLELLRKTGEIVETADGRLRLTLSAAFKRGGEIFGRKGWRRRLNITT